ncbi:peptidyl-prolyl cis-trans isomerase [Bacillus subtilis]|nr:protein secretion PrsA [Bacillus subtilis subsp. subtilis str. JH642 substr. AG174]AIC42679.1 protein secretion PrsA [Bacillus subtilis subsp. subtilis str. AG1839]AQR80013.1 Foldase protein PrsA 2 precursor [Bacillus subtilis subsp. subtilis str. 168]QHM02553.1 Foldase protein PrsA 2 [Bacillus subtilis]AQR84226.1 Foldase protein PrsA 2 precursor [Bacillus subtilis subsp. subtilis str. 168]
MVCCIAVAYTLTKSQAGASSSGESIATIGGKSVTREEWLKEMEDQYGKSTLEDMINVRVVEQLAKKNKLKISKSEVDREFLLIKAVNNSFYEDEHTTEKEWKDQIRYNILLEDLLTRDIDISNKELESFYNKNKELYQFDDSYRIRHIVVKDEEEAREVLKELKGGSSFEAVAAERSTDRYTSPYGGDLGFVTEASDNIPSAYIEEAKTLKEDEWSQEPIKVSNGYAIIQLKEKLKARTFSFDEVKDQIRRQIAMDQLGDKATVKTLWKEADVSWFYGEKSTK